MQEETKTVVRDEGGIWVLNAGSILFHNAHVKESDRKRVKGCKICAADVEGVLGPMVPGSRDQTGVDKSSGVDAEGPAAPSFDSWWDRRKEGPPR